MAWAPCPLGATTSSSSSSFSHPAGCAARPGPLRHSVWAVSDRPGVPAPVSAPAALLQHAQSPLSPPQSPPQSPPPLLARACPQPPFILRLWLMSLFEPGGRRTVASLQAHLASHPQVGVMCAAGSCIFFTSAAEAKFSLRCSPLVPLLLWRVGGRSKPTLG